MEPMASIF
ncbi:hypothetical protein CFP56_013399 [Quercus suber]|uniref:Uncharacterized protein n=1 Tax=Quercus suber TaxID=58331 RepID=A0AAW0KW39_QUESU